MFGILKRNYENITGDEVKELMKDKDTVIIDVRESYEYKSGHIIGAKLIPLGQLSNRLSEIDQTKKVIVVCASGARSARAAAYLSKADYDVYNMIGGMRRWTGKVKR